MKMKLRRSGVSVNRTIQWCQDSLENVSALNSVDGLQSIGDSPSRQLPVEWKCPAATRWLAD
jgi:hypothetical protein